MFPHKFQLSNAQFFFPGAADHPAVDHIPLHNGLWVYGIGFTDDKPIIFLGFIWFIWENPSKSQERPPLVWRREIGRIRRNENQGFIFNERMSFSCYHRFICFIFSPGNKDPETFSEAGDAHIDEGVVAAAGCEIQSVRRPIRSSVLLDRFECSAWAGKAGKPTHVGV